VKRSWRSARHWQNGLIQSRKGGGQRAFADCDRIDFSQQVTPQPLELADLRLACRAALQMGGNHEVEAGAHVAGCIA
jgi:hypothetical protein